jgi:hypothetical protein
MELIDVPESRNSGLSRRLDLPDAGTSAWPQKPLPDSAAMR